MIIDGTYEIIEMSWGIPGTILNSEEYGYGLTMWVASWTPILGIVRAISGLYSTPGIA